MDQAQEGGPAQDQHEPAAMLESAELAEKHRQERGDPEPQQVGKSGLGSHYDIGGLADYGPTDTQRMNQPPPEEPTT